MGYQIKNSLGCLFFAIADTAHRPARAETTNRSAAAYSFQSFWRVPAGRHGYHGDARSLLPPLRFGNTARMWSPVPLGT